MKKQTEGHAYDNIKTARELIKEVAMYGLSTNVEDICRAQDIFGHSTVGELAELANSKEEVGNKRVGSLFHFIAFEIWGWERATSFWNEHSNPEHKELKKLRQGKEELTKAVDSLSERLFKETERSSKASQERAELEIKCRKQEEELIRLKARLFDMMEKTA